MKQPDPFALSSYFYDLPEELIAQQPSVPRDASRLLVIERKTGSFKERRFKDIKEYLEPQGQLILNNTKVIPARLIGRREGGGAAEIFLLKKVSEESWEVLARPGKKIKNGSKVFFQDGFSCQIIDTYPNGTKKVQFQWQGSFEECLKVSGQIPLPPYIRRTPLNSDETSYQTLFAQCPGAVAAPTAGLHFTQELLEELNKKGIEQVKITLHVGAGTFKPVETEDIRFHPMHFEPFSITEEAAAALNHHSNCHHICVGTTCCRALESAANSQGYIQPGSYETNLFIYPGYSFKYVKALLTNFHLPGSSLLMLVCAFAGYELAMEAYAKAIKERFRFYSYGDAMLIL